MEITLKSNLLLIKKHKNTRLTADMAVTESDEDKKLITGEVLKSNDGAYASGDTVIFGRYALLELALQGESYFVLDVADVVGECSYKE